MFPLFAGQWRTQPIVTSSTPQGAWQDFLARPVSAGASPTVTVLYQGIAQAALGTFAGPTRYGTNLPLSRCTDMMIVCTICAVPAPRNTPKRV